MELRLRRKRPAQVGQTDAGNYTTHSAHNTHKTYTQHNTTLTTNTTHTLHTKHKPYTLSSSQDLLILAGGRAYFIHADSEEEMERWVEALSKVCCLDLLATLFSTDAQPQQTPAYTTHNTHQHIHTAGTAAAAQLTVSPIADDMLCEVLKWLPPGTIASSVAPVCKRMFRIVSDERLWFLMSRHHLLTSRPKGSTRTHTHHSHTCTNTAAPCARPLSTMAHRNLDLFL